MVVRVSRQQSQSLLDVRQQLCLYARADFFQHADLRERLKPLIRKSQPYTKRIAHQGIWVEPELLAEIEYRAKSAEGKVRHPFFKGLRDDL